MKNCKECGKEFEPKRSAILHRTDTKFCGDSCRTAYVTKHGSFGSTPAPSVKEEPEAPKPAHVEIPKVGITDPSALFIISQLERDRNRWERDYDQEREARRKIKKELSEARDQIRKMETDRAIESASKSGLSGLGENPLVQGLIPFLGPVIQKIGERAVDFATPAPAQAIEGAAGSAPEEKAFREFKAWFMALSPDVQKSVWEILEALSVLGNESEANLISTLNQIQNFHLSQYVRKSA